MSCENDREQRYMRHVAPHCHMQIPILSAIGKGPRGEKGDRGDPAGVNEFPYYEEITLESLRFNDECDYYIVHVPHLDSEGNIIPLSFNLHGGVDPLEHAWDAHTSFTVNGGCGILTDSTHKYVSGAELSNGKIPTWPDGRQETMYDFSTFTDVVDYPESMYYPCYICFKPDRTLDDFKMTDGGKTAQALKAAGYVNVTNAYFKYYDDGQAINIDSTEHPLTWNGEGIITSETKDIWVLMGYNESNKDLWFAMCEGRTDANVGMTIPDLANELISRGCHRVYGLDGGGSACFVRYGSKVNVNHDAHGRDVRLIPKSINFIKQHDENSVDWSFENHGRMRQLMMQQNSVHSSVFNPNARTRIGWPDECDLDELTKFGNYFCWSKTDNEQRIVNAPTNISGFDLYVLPMGGGAVKQVYSTWGYETVYQRYYDNGWTDWKLLCSTEPMNVSFELPANGTCQIPYMLSKFQMLVVFGSSSQDGDIGAMQFIACSNTTPSTPYIHEITLAKTDDTTDLMLPSYSIDDADKLITITNNAGVYVMLNIVKGLYLYV